MSHFLRLLAIAALLSVAACVGQPVDPQFSTVTIAPVPPEMARIYFYREWEPYESMSRPRIYLNGEQAAVSIPGGVSYRDVPAGRYEITVDSPGIYSGQFKTVNLQPGQNLYVKIESLRNWYRGYAWEMDTFYVALIPGSQARAEIGSKRYVQGDANS